MSDQTVEESPDLSREELIAALANVYEAGYRLHDSLDDVDPGYEYAIQQVCSELECMGLIDNDGSIRAMNLAQDRHFGEPERESDRPLSEFGDSTPVGGADDE